MPTTDSPASSSRQSIFPLVALLIGVLLIGLSLVWPRLSTGRAQWSDEQALKYQATSAELHSLSHEMAQHADEDEESAALAQRHYAAQEEFAQLHSQLEAARESPARLATIMQILGSVLVAVGAVLYYVKRLQA